MRMCHIVICGPPRCTVFFHIISWTSRFPKKKSYGIQNACFDFLYNFVWNLSYCKKNWATYDKNVYWSSCKVPFILVRFSTKLEFFDRFSKNLEISIFTKNRPVEAELFHVDGQTDMKKLIVAFRSFVKAPKGAPWCLQKRCLWNVIDHCICVNAQYYIIYVTMPCVKCHHLRFLYLV